MKNNINVKKDGSFEVKLNTSVEAHQVLDGLIGMIHDYGEATVADLKETIGETPSMEDYKVQWKYLLRGTSVSRVEGGYILKLPKPRVLD